MTATQRAAYGRAWRLAHPDYHRAYNRAHPKAAGTRQAWRKANPLLAALARRRENVARSGGPVFAPIPDLHRGHALFAAARLLVPDGTPMTLYAGEREQERDEARSEAVLAMLEGRDPAEAVRLSRSRDGAWRTMTCEPVVEQ